MAYLKLSEKWKGPAKVTKCLGPFNYAVSFLDKPEDFDTCHVQNLKPYYSYNKSFSEGAGM